ncbi:rhodanese-like domain-containing protein [Desulfosporosinus metallidurans]|uniref:Rhodanese n=1 Tax=Desulfosporosinus metallidurans TaxID=1888891 RepID=A0A1Q8QZE9_9FIRM|nr:rhodanese-like domain-containing protein [Desulfosporosinus metallidurans]OLN32742.1 Rhodanese [Desulfosporosinus metallidurans]
MLKRKTNYTILLILVLSLLLSGCGQQAAPTTSSTVLPTTSSTPAEDPVKVVKGAINTFYYTAADSGSYLIAPDKLKAELEKNPANYLVLDVRKATDYTKGHINGAVNVPFGTDIGINLDKIRAAAKGKTVVVICYSGQSAAQVTSTLNIAGIKTLTLIGGMGSPDPVKGWLGSKYPVVTDAVNMPSSPAVDSPNKTIDKVVKDYFFKLPEDSNFIDGKILHDKLASSPDSYMLVDIRKPEDFAKGHIKGAINYPYGTEIAKNLDTIIEKGKGKTVIVNCYSGITAGQTVALLNTIGVNAKSLLSGYEVGWAKLFPTEVQQ